MTLYMGRQLFIVFLFPSIALKRTLFSLKLYLIRSLPSYNSILDFAHKIFNVTNNNKQQKILIIRFMLHVTYTVCNQKGHKAKFITFLNITSRLMVNVDLYVTD
jgi:hypothetical protein